MNERIKADIIKMITKYNYVLVDFKYYKKIFGNIVLVVENHEKKITFVTDRGDIYCNGVLLCDHEYLRNGKISTQQQLINQIELYLKK